MRHLLSTSSEAFEKSTLRIRWRVLVVVGTMGIAAAVALLNISIVSTRNDADSASSILQKSNSRDNRQEGDGPWIHTLNSSCTSHIQDRPTKHKYSSELKKSCKFLPEPKRVARRCATEPVDRLLSSFANEQTSIQRFVMFVGSGHSGHSLVGSLLDSHPSILVANEADVFSKWLHSTDFLHWRKEPIEHGRPLPTKQDIFDEILSNSLKCHLYTRWQHGYNYTIPGGWGGQWRPGRLTVVGDKKGGMTKMRLSELHRKGVLAKAFRAFQQEIGNLPIRIVHAYWAKDHKKKDADKLLHELLAATSTQSDDNEPPPLSVYEWNSTVYACGDQADRMALLEGLCNFLEVPCDAALLDTWSSFASCRSASGHVE